MAEKYCKSKLKRNKSSVKDLHTVTLKKSQTTLFSGGSTAETGRSVVPAAVWWKSEQLPAVESLWALTLKSALPYLENQHWDLVLDLPHPSTAAPTALKLDEQWWCDISEEVAPFPDPAPPSLKTSLSPDPLRLSSSQQELSVQPKPAADLPHTQLSSQSRHSHNGKRTSQQARTKRPQPSIHSWERSASSAATSVDGDEGPVNGKLTNEVKVSDAQVSLRWEGDGEEEEEVVEDKEEEEVQGSARGDGDGGGGGGAGLQSCPMCLLVFPVGFTQMDCDGHLAQCLSEANVDMTW